jgi:group I intron endonuclease
MYYIYLITNRLTSKIYVGLTENTDDRWYQHLTDARSWIKYPENGRGLYINEMMAKEGIDNFVFTPIQTYTSAIEVCRAETWWIDFFPSLYPQGYNMCRGGTSQTPETRAKISASLMGHPVSERARQVLREVNIGREPWNKGTKGVMAPNATSFPKGEDHNSAKLTAEQAVEISSLYRVTDMTQKEIGQLFGIADNTVSSIIRGDSWPHLTSIQLSEEEREMKRVQNRQRGEDRYNATLTAEQVLQIVSIHKTTGSGARELSEAFNVSKAIIKGILYGTTWSHLTGIIHQNNGINKGEDCYNAKLSTEQVLHIMALNKNERLSERKLAKQFNVGRSTIRSILQGNTWSHLTGIPKPPKKSKP